MIGLILAFVAGLIVMDLVWAHKLGLTRVVFARIKQRFTRKETV